jgi:hypothetical protein
MGSQSGALSDGSETWNYFNYFTEVEEHFQRARGTGLFLMSPLDWALVETWKNAEIPLEAVLRGIDVAFEKWHAKKKKLQQVNSLTYCAQAVYLEAQVMAGAGVNPKKATVEAPFTQSDLIAYLQTNAETLRKVGSDYAEIAASLDRIASEAAVHFQALETLEQRLTGLEEKMSAIAKAKRSEDDMLCSRKELESTLRPYRSKMTAAQLSMLERQYLERRIFENEGLPRLSLFYLR